MQLFEEKCVFGDSVVGILCITNEKEGIFNVADAIIGRGYAKYESDEATFFSCTLFLFYLFNSTITPMLTGVNYFSFVQRTKSVQRLPFKKIIQCNTGHATACGIHWQQKICWPR